MTQISLKHVTKLSKTLQKLSNTLKPPSIRGRNSKLALNLHCWFEKSLINMGNYTMIQDFEIFPRAGPT